MRRAAKRWMTALGLGLLFGLGLGLSGMTQPDKVLAFLDVTGDWDPSLALVMVGAIGAFALAFRLAGRRDAPLLGGRFPRLPKRLDGRLLGGAALFGLGWGLAGICPGPALVDLGAGLGDVALFSVAMVAGMG
ncbi:MAG: YeeE/YedE family protein, partial [Deltaproteobacteria bacterium]